MKKLILIFCVLFLPIFSFAQTVLKNADVIELVKSGLSAGIISAKIKASETDFDTSTEALKILSENGVPEAVVVTMLEIDKVKRDKLSATKQTSESSRNDVPEQGTLADLTNLKKVYISAQTAKSRDIIAKVLKSKSFEIVDKLENSDFAIKYEETVEEVGAVATAYGNTARARTETQKVGNFTVIMPSSDSNRIRLIYSTRKTEYYVWESNPAESATKQFLKDIGKIKPVIKVKT